MILCMIIASVLFIGFVFLFMTASDDMIDAMLICCKEIEIENQKNLQAEMKLLVDSMKHEEDLKDKTKIKKGKGLKKKLDTSKKRYEVLEKGKISVLEIIPITGYRLMQLLKLDITNEVVKKLNQKCIQFKEKKEAMNYTYYLLSSLFGYSLLGILLFFLILGLLLSMGFSTRSFVIASMALVVFFVLGYVPYDNVNDVIRKRKEEIENQFPQVISKMTLLTVAGMEVNQAWKLTCSNEKGVLYDEMRCVMVELDNNVPPAEAYSKFISHCNNTYTTKLGTAIIQNISKGNSEIVTLFRTLNDESWMEHKHNARRKGEAIQSKLMIPTLLMFFGILVLVILPVMSGFGF